MYKPNWRSLEKVSSKTVEEMCGTVWNTMLYGTTAKCTTKAEILSVNVNTPVYIKD